MKRLLVAAVVVGLSGCAGIPATSSIHYGQDISTGASSQYTRVIAQPPSKDMSQEAIVRGFLEACAAPSADYTIAREYLLAKASLSWDPSTGTDIFDDTAMTVSTARTGVTVTAPLLATISAGGHMTTRNRIGSAARSFELARDEFGQWRISNLANGLMLSRSNVDRGYKSLAVYFLNVGNHNVVADTVTVPVSSGAIPTTLVKAVLAGPSTELAPAVHSAFPSGTQLTYGSVPVTDGVATVDLTQDVLNVSAAERKAMAAQLTWTLTQVPSIAAVRISVSGQALSIPGIGQQSRVNDWSALAPRPDRGTMYVAQGNSVISLEGETPQPIAVIASSSPGRIGTMTVDYATGAVAATTNDRTHVLMSDPTTGKLRNVLSGDAFSRPSWDHSSAAYVADYGRGVLRVDGARNSSEVPVEQSAIGTAKQIQSISIAPDGIHVALVFVEGSEQVLGIGTLVTDKNGARITAVHLVEHSITQIRDITWATAISVRAIGSIADSAIGILDVDLATGRVSWTAAPAGSQTLGVDVSGNNYVGVVEASVTTIQRMAYSKWTVVAKGTSPALGP